MFIGDMGRPLRAAPPSYSTTLAGMARIAIDERSRAVDRQSEPFLRQDCNHALNEETGVLLGDTHRCVLAIPDCGPETEGAAEEPGLRLRHRSNNGLRPDTRRNHALRVREQIAVRRI